MSSNKLAGLLVLVWGAVLGGFPVWWAAGAPEPRPPIETRSWRITSSGGYAVTPQRPLDLPSRYGDFDLRCRIEMPEDGDVDLVFRKVENWGPRGISLPIFHARFHVLRVSSRKSGPGFLSREQALFDAGRGGIWIDPGAPGASVELQCRGRQARALVNGVELGPIETLDDYGNFGVIARGGNALLHDFALEAWPAAPRPTSWTRGAWWWGALAGALAAALLLGLRCSPFAVAIGMLAGLAGAFLASDRVFAHLLPVVDPLPGAVLLGGLSGLPFGCGLAVLLSRPWRRRRLSAAGALGAGLALIVGAAGSLAMLEATARHEEPYLAPFEDRRLDLTFGQESGTAPYDALARVLTGTYRKHMPMEQRHDVLLLGGKTFFDLDVPGQEALNVGAVLPAIVQRRLGQSRSDPILCAAIPTQVSHSYQQLLLFRSFYRSYRPRVVVLGLTGDEGEPGLSLPARELHRVASQPRPRSGSVLLDLGRAVDRRPSAPVQSPADLAATLGELRALCDEIGSKLILAVDDSLQDGYLDVTRGFAAENGIPLVPGFAVHEGRYPIAALAEQVVGELIR